VPLGQQVNTLTRQFWVFPFNTNKIDLVYFHSITKVATGVREGIYWGAEKICPENNNLP